MSFTSLAQDFNIGMGLQANAYKKYDINKSESILKIIPYFTEFHLGLEYLPGNNLGIEFRVGWFMFQKYGINGIEYGLTGKYYMLQNICLIGTYTIHLNYESGGNFGARDATFGMPGIGIGYKVAEPIRFELTFLDPKNTIIENYFESIINPVALNWLIRLNFGFYIPL